MSASGTHWVTAQDTPKRETRHVLATGDRVKEVQKRIVDVSIWDTIQARGSVTHDEGRRTFVLANRENLSGPDV